MVEKKDKFYGSKDEIRKIIDEAVYAIRADRKTLASKLGVANVTLHSWIMKGFIPWRHHQHLLQLTTQEAGTVELEKKSKTQNSKLKDFSTGELIDELISRGVKVSLGQ